MENENTIQVFENYNFGKIRVMMIDGEPWFVGKDIAVALGYADSKHAVLDHVDAEDRVNSKTRGQNAPEFGQRGTWLINESGVYSLILTSKLPTAKAFKHWVTAEILTSIRKYGAYMTPDVIEKTLLNPDYIIQLATVLKQEQEKNKLLVNKIQQDKPLVEFANRVSNASNLIDMGQFAKLVKDEHINIGRNKLFGWLRDKGYLMKSDAHNNEPYQQYINQGYFSVKEYTYSTPYGEKVGTKTYVTGKGQIYFVEKLRQEFCENM